MNANPSRELSDAGWYCLIAFAGAILYVLLALLFSTPVYYAVVAMTAAFGMWLSFSRLRRARAMEDMPTSTIRGAVQGYVELRGVASVAGNLTVRAPLSGKECCWWLLSTCHQKKGLRKMEFSFTRSTTLLRLTDDTGECLIDPALFTVFETPTLTKYGDTADASRANGTDPRSEYCFVEHRIPLGSPIVAIGNFSRLERDLPVDVVGKATDILVEAGPARFSVLSALDENPLIAKYRKGAAFAFRALLLLLGIALLIEHAMT